MAQPKKLPPSYSGTQLAWLDLSKDNLVSLRDSAQKLNVSAFSVRRWIRDGRIRAVKVAGRYRIRQSEILKFIHEVHPDAPQVPSL